MQECDLPAPRFEDTRGTFRVILYNGAEDLSSVRFEPQMNLAATDEKGLLAFCRTPRSRGEIVAFLAIASGQYARRRYLDPLVHAGAIRMTKPEAPRSRDQRYVTVE